MKISLDWLGEFVTFNPSTNSGQATKDPQEIAKAITAHTAEVDEVISQGKFLDGCCIGKVLKIEKHSNADKLSLCDVETDKGTKRVVCGGSNLRDGMKVVFAHVGATVCWHGTDVMKLEKVKIRGEESHGMICAAEEVGLVEQFPDSVDSKIIDLGDGDDGVGKSVKEYLGAGDVTLDIDNHAITNRADLFSHLGFARECVSMGIAKWKKEPSYKAPKFTSSPLPFKIKNEAEKLIPRYLACVLQIDDLGETPEWMKRRLEATGWRSLNLPIDITNYVTMELGMPLHSFDIGDIKGDISMRTTKKGEKIRTLDDVERELPEGAIVLSDKEGIFDLLGVMGGLRSSTKADTKQILLHSAIVDPVSIRNTIIATGHRTDASTIYEKNIPLVTAESGFYRALELFLELVPGAKIVSKMDSWGDNGKASPINLSVDRVNSMLGMNLDSKKIKSILESLGFTVSGSGKELKVTAPLWRLGDIEGDHDLIEEVGRIYGFDDVDVVMPSAGITPPERDQRVNRVRDALRRRGYFEHVPLCFVGSDLLKACDMDPAETVEVENAIGEELSLMQPSILPRLLEHAGENLRHSEEALKTFNVSHVFDPNGEHEELCMVISAKRDPDLKTCPFLHLKADLISALADAGYTLSVQKSAACPRYAHPGRCADLIVDGETIGQLFEVTPAVRERFGLEHRVSAITLDLDALLTLESIATIATPIPQFPSVTYDVTVTMDQNKEVSKIITSARAKSELLKDVEVADLYMGESLKAGQYNLTLRLTYRSDERTLTEEEVKKEHEEVMEVL